MNDVSTVHPTSTSSRNAMAAFTRDAHVDALVGLYRTHCTTLVRLTSLLVRDIDVAIAIVDEVFVREARARRERARELPTIGVLRNAVVALARERPPVPRAPGGRTSPLLEALFALPHAQRESLVLQHYGALSDDDVVGAAGVPLETVTAHATEGLRALDAAVRAQQDR